MRCRTLGLSGSTVLCLWQCLKSESRILANASGRPDSNARVDRSSNPTCQCAQSASVCDYHIACVDERTAKRTGSIDGFSRSDQLKSAMEDREKGAAYAAICGDDVPVSATTLNRNDQEWPFRHMHITAGCDASL